MSDRDVTRPRDSGRHIPPIAISETSTLVNPTGSWKYIMPRYEDRVAPCNAGCPVGIDIEGYMYLIGQGRLEEAAALLISENPMRRPAPAASTMAVNSKGPCAVTNSKKCSLTSSETLGLAMCPNVAPRTAALYRSTQIPPITVIPTTKHLMPIPVL